MRTSQPETCLTFCEFVDKKKKERISLDVFVASLVQTVRKWSRFSERQAGGPDAAQ